MSTFAEQLTNVGLIESRQELLTKTEIDEIQALEPFADDDTKQRMTWLIRRMLQNSCVGLDGEKAKIRYTTMQDAEEGLKWFQSKFPKNEFGEINHKVVYLCPFCESYHFGNPASQLRLATERELVEIAKQIKQERNKVIESTEEPISQEPTYDEIRVRISAEQVRAATLAEQIAPIDQQIAELREKQIVLVDEIKAVERNIEGLRAAARTIFERDFGGTVVLPSSSFRPSHDAGEIRHRGRVAQEVPPEVIARIHQLRAKNKPWHEIARILNEEDFRTVTGKEFTMITARNYGEGTTDMSKLNNN
jgi:hypothetical protein